MPNTTSGRSSGTPIEGGGTSGSSGLHYHQTNNTNTATTNNNSDVVDPSGLPVASRSNSGNTLIGLSPMHAGGGLFYHNPLHKPRYSGIPTTTPATQSHSTLNHLHSASTVMSTATSQSSAPLQRQASAEGSAFGTAAPTSKNNTTLGGVASLHAASNAASSTLGEALMMAMTASSSGSLGGTGAGLPGASGSVGLGVGATPNGSYTPSGGNHLSSASLGGLHPPSQPPPPSASSSPSHLHSGGSVIGQERGRARSSSPRTVTASTAAGRGGGVILNARGDGQGMHLLVRQHLPHQPRPRVGGSSTTNRAQPPTMAPLSNAHGAPLQLSSVGPATADSSVNTPPTGSWHGMVRSVGDPHSMGRATSLSTPAALRRLTTCSSSSSAQPLSALPSSERSHHRHPQPPQRPISDIDRLASTVMTLGSSLGSSSTRSTFSTSTSTGLPHQMAPSAGRAAPPLSGGFRRVSTGSLASEIRSEPPTQPHQSSMPNPPLDAPQGGSSGGSSIRGVMPSSGVTPHASRNATIASTAANGAGSPSYLSVAPHGSGANPQSSGLHMYSSEKGEFRPPVASVNFPLPDHPSTMDVRAVATTSWESAGVQSSSGALPSLSSAQSAGSEWTRQQPVVTDTPAPTTSAEARTDPASSTPSTTRTGGTGGVFKSFKDRQRLRGATGGAGGGLGSRTSVLSSKNDSHTCFSGGDTGPSRTTHHWAAGPSTTAGACTAASASESISFAIAADPTTPTVIHTVPTELPDMVTTTSAAEQKTPALSPQPVEEEEVRPTATEAHPTASAAAPKEKVEAERCAPKPEEQQPAVQQAGVASDSSSRSSSSSSALWSGDEKAPERGVRRGGHRYAIPVWLQAAVEPSRSPESPTALDTQLSTAAEEDTASALPKPLPLAVDPRAPTDLSALPDTERNEFVPFPEQQTVRQRDDAQQNRKSQAAGRRASFQGSSSSSLVSSVYGAAKLGGSTRSGGKTVDAEEPQQGMRNTRREKPRTSGKSQHRGSRHHHGVVARTRSRSHKKNREHHRRHRHHVHHSPFQVFSASLAGTHDSGTAAPELNSAHTSAGSFRPPAGRLLGTAHKRERPSRSYRPAEKRVATPTQSTTATWDDGSEKYSSAGAFSAVPSHPPHHRLSRARTPRESTTSSGHIRSGDSRSRYGSSSAGRQSLSPPDFLAFATPTSPLASGEGSSSAAEPGSGTQRQQVSLSSRHSGAAVGKPRRKHCPQHSRRKPIAQPQRESMVSDANVSSHPLSAGEVTRIFSPTSDTVITTNADGGAEWTRSSDALHRERMVRQLEDHRTGQPPHSTSSSMHEEAGSRNDKHEKRRKGCNSPTHPPERVAEQTDSPANPPAGHPRAAKMPSSADFTQSWLSEKEQHAPRQEWGPSLSPTTLETTLHPPSSTVGLTARPMSGPSKTPANHTCITASSACTAEEAVISEVSSSAGGWGSSVVHPAHPMRYAPMAATMMTVPVDGPSPLHEIATLSTAVENPPSRKRGTEDDLLRQQQQEARTSPRVGLDHSRDAPVGEHALQAKTPCGKPCHGEGDADDVNLPPLTAGLSRTFGILSSDVSTAHDVGKERQCRNGSEHFSWSPASVGADLNSVTQLPCQSPMPHSSTSRPSHALTTKSAAEDFKGNNENPKMQRKDRGKMLTRSTSLYSISGHPGYSGVLWATAEYSTPPPPPPPQWTSGKSIETIHHANTHDGSSSSGNGNLQQEQQQEQRLDPQPDPEAPTTKGTPQQQQGIITTPTSVGKTPPSRSLDMPPNGSHHTSSLSEELSELFAKDSRQALSHHPPTSNHSAAPYPPLCTGGVGSREWSASRSNTGILTTTTPLPPPLEPMYRDVHPHPSGARREPATTMQFFHPSALPSTAHLTGGGSATGSRTSGGGDGCRLPHPTSPSGKHQHPPLQPQPSSGTLSSSDTPSAMTQLQQHRSSLFSSGLQCRSPPAELHHHEVSTSEEPPRDGAPREFAAATEGRESSPSAVLLGTRGSAALVDAASSAASSSRGFGALGSSSQPTASSTAIPPEGLSLDATLNAVAVLGLETSGSGAAVHPGGLWTTESTSRSASNAALGGGGVHRPHGSTGEGSSLSPPLSHPRSGEQRYDYPISTTSTETTSARKSHWTAPVLVRSATETFTFPSQLPPAPTPAQQPALAVHSIEEEGRLGVVETVPSYSTGEAIPHRSTHTEFLSVDETQKHLPKEYTAVCQSSESYPHHLPQWCSGTNNHRTRAAGSQENGGVGPHPSDKLQALTPGQPHHNNNSSSSHNNNHHSNVLWSHRAVHMDPNGPSIATRENRRTRSFSTLEISVMSRRRPAAAERQSRRSRKPRDRARDAPNFHPHRGSQAPPVSSHFHPHSSSEGLPSSEVEPPVTSLTERSPSGVEGRIPPRSGRHGVRSDTPQDDPDEDEDTVLGGVEAYSGSSRNARRAKRRSGLDTALLVNANRLGPVAMVYSSDEDEEAEEEEAVEGPVGFNETVEHIFIPTYQTERDIMVQTGAIPAAEDASASPDSASPLAAEGEEVTGDAAKDLQRHPFRPANTNTNVHPLTGGGGGNTGVTTAVLISSPMNNQGDPTEVALNISRSLFGVIAPHYAVEPDAEQKPPDFEPPCIAAADSKSAAHNATASATHSNPSFSQGGSATSPCFSKDGLDGLSSKNIGTAAGALSGSTVSSPSLPVGTGGVLRSPRRAPVSDSKVMARLQFERTGSVLLLNTRDEVERYLKKPLPNPDEEEEDDDEDGYGSGACRCDEAFITKDYMGPDFSRFNAHQLFSKCAYCSRSPSSFLCMHCLESFCPSHVSRHHSRNPEECTLFLNITDIMSSFNRIFWCEKCQRFTWKYTEMYDELVDHLAYTRGTYWQTPVRDIHCIGYTATLRVPGEDEDEDEEFLNPMLGRDSHQMMGAPGISTTPQQYTSPNTSQIPNATLESLTNHTPALMVPPAPSMPPPPTPATLVPPSAGVAPSFPPDNASSAALLTQSHTVGSLAAASGSPMSSPSVPSSPNSPEARGGVMRASGSGSTPFRPPLSGGRTHMNSNTFGSGVGGSPLHPPTLATKAVRNKLQSSVMSAQQLMQWQRASGEKGDGDATSPRQPPLSCGVDSLISIPSQCGSPRRIPSVAGNTANGKVTTPAQLHTDSEGGGGQQVSPLRVSGKRLTRRGSGWDFAGGPGAMSLGLEVGAASYAMEGFSPLDCRPPFQLEGLLRGTRTHTSPQWIQQPHQMELTKPGSSLFTAAAPAPGINGVVVPLAQTPPQPSGGGHPVVSPPQVSVSQVGWHTAASPHVQPPTSFSPQHPHAGLPRLGSSPKHFDFTPVQLSEPCVAVGHAVSKLAALGASVRGWRTTQEDAEAAFLVYIPEFRAEEKPNDKETSEETKKQPPSEGEGSDFLHKPTPSSAKERRIPMAVFCVFDGHGGDTVAKLAAVHFETHLRHAIARVRNEEEPYARALLFHINADTAAASVNTVGSSPSTSGMQPTAPRHTASPSSPESGGMTSTPNFQSSLIGGAVEVPPSGATTMMRPAAMHPEYLHPNANSMTVGSGVPAYLPGGAPPSPSLGMPFFPPPPSPHQLPLRPAPDIPSHTLSSIGQTAGGCGAPLSRYSSGSNHRFSRAVVAAAAAAAAGSNAPSLTASLQLAQTPGGAALTTPEHSFALPPPLGFNASLSNASPPLMKNLGRPNASGPPTAAPSPHAASSFILPVTASSLREHAASTMFGTETNHHTQNLLVPGQAAPDAAAHGDGQHPSSYPHPHHGTPRQTPPQRRKSHAAAAVLAWRQSVAEEYTHHPHQHTAASGTLPNASTSFSTGAFTTSMTTANYTPAAAGISPTPVGHLGSVSVYPSFSSPLESVACAPPSLNPVAPFAASTVTVNEMEMLRRYFTNIMVDALQSLDKYLQNTPEGSRGDYNCVGCTACIVGITSNFILCANVGDSGAALYNAREIIPISTTHRIADPKEQARIVEAGYAISQGRIEGLLAVPRALGDFDFKQCGGKPQGEQAVSCIPDVTVRPVPNAAGGQRWGVILACDGVWDTLTRHQVHYALTNTANDLVVAESTLEAVTVGKELVEQRRRGPKKIRRRTKEELRESLAEKKNAAKGGVEGKLVGVPETAKPSEDLKEGKASEPDTVEEQLESDAAHLLELMEEDLGSEISFPSDRRGHAHHLREPEESHATGKEADKGGETNSPLGLRNGSVIDATLLTAATGIFAQCVAPEDNEEGIGLDNCSLILIENRS